MHRDGAPPPDRTRPRELDGPDGVERHEEPRGVEAREGREAPGRPGAGGMSPAAAFEEAIERHARRLYALAYRLTASRAEAEDLSQETLVRGCLAIKGFRGKADFYTYLYRVLLNLWKNQIRSRRRWRFLSLAPDPRRGAGDDPPPPELADRSPGPHEALEGRERSERLHRALQALDPEFRAVLVLRVAEGLEYEEIAEVLGIRIGTVRSRLARARARIREVMDR
jgi:RNA polymerase sigma-70 factor, ECF subfamily